MSLLNPANQHSTAQAVKRIGASTGVVVEQAMTPATDSAASGARPNDELALRREATDQHVSATQAMAMRMMAPRIANPRRARPQ